MIVKVRKAQLFCLELKYKVIAHLTLIQTKEIPLLLLFLLSTYSQQFSFCVKRKHLFSDYLRGQSIQHQLQFTSRLLSCLNGFVQFLCLPAITYLDTQRSA